MDKALTRVNVPTPTMRALHSRFIDWLLDEAVGMVIRHAMVSRCEGADFTAFTHALLRERLVLTQRTDGETGEMYLGIAVPGETRAMPLFELGHLQSGMSAEDVVGVSLADLDAELARLLSAAAGGDNE